MWYLKIQLAVTKAYPTMEYTRRKPLSLFKEEVSGAKRERNKYKKNHERSIRSVGSLIR